VVVHRAELRVTEDGVCGIVTENWIRPQICCLQVKNPLLSEGFGLDHEARVAVSDSLLVLEQSVPIFKQMMRMQSTPNESMLLSFLKKIKVFVEGIGVKESLLLPMCIERKDLLMLLERTTERLFTVVVVNTAVSGGLQFHACSPLEAMPQIKYRTCLVLKDVPKKNIYDDVFWMALYNMAIRKDHETDVRKFYEVLLPFLTGKPLESSLVEAERDSLQDCSGGDDVSVSSVCGSYRFPTLSNTAHVHCVLEALNYMLRRRALSNIQADLVSLLQLMVLPAAVLHRCLSDAFGLMSRDGDDDEKRH
jgi:hypothetical protein